MGNVAGQTIIAGRVSGEQIGIAVVSSDSATFTAETEVMTITVSVISGCTYVVDAEFKIASSVAADVADGRIREDSVSGAELQFSRQTIDSITQGVTFRIMAPFTASSSGSKTFSITGFRIAGTGNLRLEAFSSRPAVLRVIYTGG